MINIITLFLLISMNFHLESMVMAADKLDPSVISTEVLVKALDSYNEKDFNSDERAKVVKSTLSLLNENPNFTYQQYWKSVFLTFDCELKDKGKILPTCIISKLSEIKSLLKKAHQAYPSHHFCAPARTLGIMYFKMPAIVGGSHKKAFQYISEAHKCAPDYDENQEWYETIKKEVE